MAAKTSGLSSILLDEANYAAVAEALSALRGRSRVFPAAIELIDAASKAERRLEKAGVAISSRPGCTYQFRDAGPSAASYGYKKTVTSFSLKRSAKGWVATHAGNEDVHPKTREINRINLTPKTKHAVVYTALAGFGLLPEKAKADLVIAGI
ncbi:hypothetical protein MKK55_18110 [Methylobacterium sp. J-059]|uniref:hypothetical protein n=1 Tax=Methylobacterium sp. J-059 TaxID=2836643 RepID=UPI001FBB8757|nr:hypothetical protein [Methylobacterium sp. J-059]MCJ2040847.1 hypothetical protein [Methylobacterium sp. J-059]